jgi:hypothetical protein
MKIRGLVWIGIDSPRYAEMKSFLQSLGQPRVIFEETDTTEFEFADGTRAQLTATNEQARVVPLFEIADDIGQARQELVDSGLLAGEINADDAWEWFVVEAPDGQRFEIGRRR